MNKKSFLLHWLSLIFAAGVSGQVASPADGQYTVADRGPFWRTWQRSTHLTNYPPGATFDKVEQYVELDNGACYLGQNGEWLDSQDLVEITPTGAAAVRGQTKAYFAPNINTAGAITLVTASGQTFRWHPLGLYYRDLSSGRVALIAPVKDTIGVLVPPNTIVFSNAFSGLNASILLTYAHNGFEQSVLMSERPPAPDLLAGFPVQTSRLEIWSALDQWPAPREERDVTVKQGANGQPDLTDQILFYADVWLPVPAAFSFGDGQGLAPGHSMPVRVPSLADTNHVLMGKSIEQIQGGPVLVESVNYEDVLPHLQMLQASAKRVDQRKRSLSLASGRGRSSPASTTSMTRPLEVASTEAIPKGFLLDAPIPLSGSSNSMTFSNGWTYLISSSFQVGSGTATFQPNSVVKYKTNAYLILYGPVSFPSSGNTPDVFTSADDNAYGAQVSGSTGNPYYAAKQAIWMYYETQYTDINDTIIRWSQTGIEEDENYGVYNSPKVSSTSFMNCSVGINFNNIANDTLYLSQDTYCNVPSPLNGPGGHLSGSMTMDCGVVSVARVNDPTQDTASGDPNKNSQSECSFVAFNATNIVAAFFDTHRSEYALGYYNWFTGITSPRATSWSVSTNSGTAFVEQGAIPPTSPPDTTQGDAGDPAMVLDVSSNVIYLLTNPSRDGGWNSTNFTGFRLWTSSNGGQSFTLVNTNVGLVGSTSGVVMADKPMIAVNNYSSLSTWHHLYVAGTSTGHGVIVTHSADGGHTWDPPQILQSNTQVADIGIRPNGAVYIFYQAFALDGNGGQTNWLEYNWLPAGQSTWQGPATLSAHATSTSLYSTNQYGGGLHLRSNGAAAADHFVGNGFPRVAVNPVSGRVYVAYSDLPSTSATIDQGDIFIQEGIPNSDDSITNWSGEIKVNNDRTTTDQWDPAVTINPAGTEIFVGYYSRQVDPNNNALIKAYGAKANISNGLIGATFDTFPISSVAFTNLFPGTLNSTPSTSPWLFDNVWVQWGVYFDTNAMVVTGPTPYRSAAIYATFTADDYTWTVADSSYFYFVWRDCSDLCTNTWNGINYVRADPNIRLGKVKQ